MRTALRDLRRIVGFGLIVILSSSRPAVVEADAFPWLGYYADNSLHSYCWASPMSMKDEAEWAMIYALANDTDMSRSYSGYCDGYDYNTDVWFYSYDLPYPARGQYDCVGFDSPTICGTADIVFDIPQIEGDGDLWWYDRVKTACHEIGHSVGLAHAATATDCMDFGAVPGTQIQWRNYNSHHIYHINSRY